MVYNTNGSSHRIGVINEIDICNFLNMNEDTDPLTFRRDLNCSTRKLVYKHIGGTSSVSDMDIIQGGDVLASTSIKNHKTGTFDYINTSKMKELLPMNIINKMDLFKKSIIHNYHGDHTKINHVREKNNEFTNSIFKYINSDNIKNILLIIHKRNPKYMIINDISCNKLKVYKHSQLKELSNYPKLNDTNYILKSKNASTSRSIYRVTSGGEEINTNLRIRITFNNGINALLGLSSSNKTSTYTIKVQQDNIDKVLETIESFSECSY